MKKNLFFLFQGLCNLPYGLGLIFLPDQVLSLHYVGNLELTDSLRVVCMAYGTLLASTGISGFFKALVKPNADGFFLMFIAAWGSFLYLVVHSWALVQGIFGKSSLGTLVLTFALGLWALLLLMRGSRYSAETK